MKKIIIRSSVILVVVLVVLLVFAVGIGWALSGKISGERLQQVQASPNYMMGVFFNIEPEAASEFEWDKTKQVFVDDPLRQPQTEIPVDEIDPQLLKSKPEAGLRTIWLGHASVIIEIDGYRVMVDPHLSQRASPFQFIGPQRFHQPPIALEQLEGIDAVMISHNHYDHLDESTIRHLATQGTEFFIPLGSGTHLEQWDVPVEQIHEMDWWNEAKLGELNLIITPARHYSNRGFFDYQKTLWASWSIIGSNHRVFFSGDSGYSETFKTIGDMFGPFDVGIIKIGAYGPGDLWHDIHMTPEEAIQVHLDVKAKRLLPVHWATFNLAYHPWEEPIELALEAAEAKQISIMTPRIGQIVDNSQPFPTKHWWKN